MCGIAGILKFDGTTPDTDVLALMTNAMVHRGPDDSGDFSDGPIALGFRRLSIIDLVRGHQPLSDVGARYTIVFNGEIYNHEILRNELEEQHGCVFATFSDTEVILQAYAIWGEAALSRFNGMFAFAIWDSQEKSLFAARDRLGKKPFYYVRTADALIFSSEIKALLASGLIAANPDKRRIPTFLAHRYMPGNETLLEGIEVLEPASCMTVAPSGDVRGPARWWDYSFGRPSGGASGKADCGRHEEELVRLLEDAVRLRMIADVPVGAFLSGGLDSSLIVALMSKLHSEPVKTFSIGFDTGFSEESYARVVAERFGTDHHEVIVSAQDLIRAMLPALWARETPISEPSDIPILLLSQLARKKVTVVLSGEGSDETFAGYPKYAFMQRYGSLLRAAPAPLLRGAAKLIPERYRRAQLALEAAGQPNRLEGFAAWFGGFDAEHRAKLLNPDIIRHADSVHSYSEECLQGRADLTDDVDAMLYLDTRHWLPGNLLLRGDRMTMAHSLELRCPFLDYRLVEFAAKLPHECLVRKSEGKCILKSIAGRMLPEQIIGRRKWGFKVPVAEWFRGPLLPVLREMLLTGAAETRGYFQPGAVKTLIEDHASGRVNHDKKLWILLQLELWHRMFIDRTLKPEDSLA